MSGWLVEDSRAYLSDGVGLAVVGDLGCLRAVGGKGSDDLGGVLGLAAVLASSHGGGHKGSTRCDERVLHFD